MAQYGMHKNAKKIFFNDLYTITTPNSLGYFLALDIGKIKGYPLARLYPKVNRKYIGLLPIRGYPPPFSKDW